MMFFRFGSLVGLILILLNSSSAFAQDYPWPTYRASYPDSLPDGIYQNIVALRTGKPMQGIPYEITLPDNGDTTQRILLNTAGPLKGKPLLRGKFFVQAGKPYIRMGKLLIRLHPDRNGFYSKVYKVESEGLTTGELIVAGAMGGILGVALARGLKEGPVNMTISPDSVKGARNILIRMNLDMRTGELIDDAHWDLYMNDMRRSLPPHAVVYSPKSNFPKTPITLISGTDTLKGTLHSHSKLIFKLNRPYEMYRVYGKGMPSVEFHSQAGYNYVKAVVENDEAQFDLPKPDAGAFESDVKE